MSPCSGFRLIVSETDTTVTFECSMCGAIWTEELPR